MPEQINEAIITKYTDLPISQPKQTRFSNQNFFPPASMATNAIFSQINKNNHLSSDSMAKWNENLLCSSESKTKALHQKKK
jgi:hypothetical protein